MAANATQSIADVTGLSSDFLAILVGAFLATGGGLLVTILIDRMERRRQARAIALLCVDLMTALATTAGFARNARERGKPYGAVTMRLVERMLRDVQVFDRNRERVIELGDPKMRSELYEFMSRLSMGLEGVIAAHAEIPALEDRLEAALERGAGVKEREIRELIAEAEARRAFAFDFMLETVESGETLSLKLREGLRVQPAATAPQ